MAPSAPEPPKRAAEDPTVQREHKRPRAVATSQARGLTPVEDRIVASVLWTNPRSTVEGNHDLFKSLPCTKTFEDLREHLQGHTRTFDLFDNALIQTNLRRLLIDQVIVMAMNDYTCKTGKAGRMMHCHGHSSHDTKEMGMVVYFAGRGWSVGQREHYTKARPYARLQMSGMFAGYHWKDLDTITLKVRILDMKLMIKEGGKWFKATFFLPAKNVGEAKKLYGNEIVIWWLDHKLYCTKLGDVLDSLLLPATYTNPELADPPRLRVHNPLFKGFVAGYLQFYWYYVPGSQQCRDWGACREITSERLVEGLYARLVDELMEEDKEKSSLKNWKEALVEMDQKGKKYSQV